MWEMLVPKAEHLLKVWRYVYEPIHLLFTSMQTNNSSTEMTMVEKW